MTKKPVFIILSFLLCCGYCLNSRCGPHTVNWDRQVLKGESSSGICFFTSGFRRHGGLIIAWFAFEQLGATPVADLAPATPSVPEGLADSASGVEKFFVLNKEKLHMGLPIGDPTLPWTALVLGLWIPNLYYWGLNQFIVQRTLGSKSLSAGQRGLVMAAAIHIFSPPFSAVRPCMARSRCSRRDSRSSTAWESRFWG